MNSTRSLPSLIISSRGPKWRAPGWQVETQAGFIPFSRRSAHCALVDLGCVIANAVVTWNIERASHLAVLAANADIFVNGNYTVRLNLKSTGRADHGAASFRAVEAGASSRKPIPPV